jgi:hypothetical protein
MDSNHRGSTTDIQLTCTPIGAGFHPSWNGETIRQPCGNAAASALEVSTVSVEVDEDGGETVSRAGATRASRRSDIIPRSCSVHCYNTINSVSLISGRMVVRLTDEFDAGDAESSMETVSCMAGYSLQRVSSKWRALRPELRFC